MRFRRLPLGLPRMPVPNENVDDASSDNSNIRKNVKKLRYFGNLI